MQCSFNTLSKQNSIVDITSITLPPMSNNSTATIFQKMNFSNFDHHASDSNPKLLRDNYSSHMMITDEIRQPDPKTQLDTEVVRMQWNYNSVFRIFPP